MLCLSRLGPTLREGQRRGAEGPAFALALPRRAACLVAVQGQPSAQRRHQHGAHAVGPGIGIAVLLAEAKEGVLPGQNQTMRVCYRHSSLPSEPTLLAGVPVDCRQSLAGGRNKWANSFVEVRSQLWRDSSE